jgi:hypothetical protein
MVNAHYAVPFTMISFFAFPSSFGQERLSKSCAAETFR